MKSLLLGCVGLGLVLSLRAGAQITVYDPGTGIVTTPSIGTGTIVLNPMARAHSEEDEFQAEELSPAELLKVRDLRATLDAAQKALSQEQSSIEEAHRQKYYRSICPESAMGCTYVPPSCPTITSELQGRFIILHIVSKCTTNNINNIGPQRTIQVPNYQQGWYSQGWYYGGSPCWDCGMITIH